MFPCLYCFLMFNIAFIIASSNLTVKASLWPLETILYKYFLLPADDIPIQIVKDETTGDGKSNLVAITEEQESTETNRVGSMRQSKDQKTTSKITNFAGLGKKLKEKEKKASAQTMSKENIKATSSISNSDQAEIDANVNGCAIRKKNNTIENNTTIVDPNVTLIETERLASNNEITEGNSIETITLRTLNETEPTDSPIQISSVQ